MHIIDNVISCIGILNQYKSLIVLNVVLEMLWLKIIMNQTFDQSLRDEYASDGTIKLLRIRKC